MPDLLKSSNPHPNPYSDTRPAVAIECPPPQSESGNRNNCFRRFGRSAATYYILWILILILISDFIFIILAVYYKSLTIPDKPEFTIKSLSVSDFNFTRSNRDSGRWNLEFLIGNPNKMHSFSYDYVNCFLGHGESHLANTMVAPFEQGIREQRTVHTEFSGSVSYVDARVYDDIEKELAARGSVGFDLRFLTSVKYRYHGFGHDKDRLQLTVLCKDLTVEISADSGLGKMNGPAKKCKVDENDPRQKYRY